MDTILKDILSNNLDLENNNIPGCRSQGNDVRNYFGNYFMDNAAVPFQFR
jgi:hypothetical protein